MEPYYYNQLEKQQKAAYYTMKSGLTALAASFPVPRLEHGELSDIFFKLRLDCPEIFYASGFSYRSSRDSGTVDILPEYLFEKSKILEHRKAMEGRIARLIRPAAALSEWDRELFVHDFICTNVRYDKLKKAYSHEIIGPLGQGVGVCEGIAKTVKILCDALDIWCMIAVSDANPDRNIRYRHAWNIVKINGNHYHLDATFDNSLGGQGILRHDYFNLADQPVFRDHEPVLYKAPVCSDSGHSYYKEKKISFTKIEEVEKRAVQALRRNRPFLFHWRAGQLNRETLEELVCVLERAAQQKDRHAAVSLNRQQAVFQVVFTEIRPEEEIINEDANEGERIRE